MSGGSPRRRYVRFTRWRRRRFFFLLAESGNVQLAAELAGMSLSCIYRLRRVEAGSPRGWRRRWTWRIAGWHGLGKTGIPGDKKVDPGLSPG